MTIETDPDLDLALANPRAEANDAQWALASWHPDAGRVDSETHWLIFRDGVNWAMRRSAQLSELLRKSSELILMLDQHRCPTHCQNCLNRLNGERWPRSTRAAAIGIEDHADDDD